jgi:hypothetical protein
MLSVSAGKIREIHLSRSGAELAELGSGKYRDGFLEFLVFVFSQRAQRLSGKIKKEKRKIIPQRRRDAELERGIRKYLFRVFLVFVFPQRAQRLGGEK